MQTQCSRKRRRDTLPLTSGAAEASGWFGKLMRRGSRLAMACLVSACASRPEIVDHSFAFDALVDSPGIEILDYRYGDSRIPGATNPDDLRRKGRSLQRTLINGPMRKGASLYVKWKVLSDDKVYEQTVDLRGRLPQDLTGWKVYFLVTGPQLYVYLISPETRPANVLPNGPRTYWSRRVITIYPDQSKS